MGGQTTPIWIVNLKTLDLVKAPRENSNDSNPVWAGDSIYFLSDRNGPVSLFRYDVATKQVSQAVPNNGSDLKSVQVGPGGLVYEQFGSIHLFDAATNTDRIVPVQSTANCRTWYPTAPTSQRKKFRMPPFRPPESAPLLRRTAKSSPFPPRKETPATSPIPPAQQSAILLEPGRKNHRLFFRCFR